MNKQTTSLQHNLFGIIRRTIPTHTTLAKSVAEVLCITADAAYKKINGSRSLDLEEAGRLVRAFKIKMADLDEVNESEKISFHFAPIGKNGLTFKDYLISIRDNLASVKRNGILNITYSAKEIPMFYNFMFPELGAFKAFVWQKTLLNNPEFKATKFDPEDQDQELIDIGLEIYNAYCHIHSHEIWNYETVNCTLRQFEFCRDAGYFKNDATYNFLLEQYRSMVEHIELQCLESTKINRYTNDYLSPFDLYNNELILGDNTVLLAFDSHDMVFVTPNSINSLVTSDRILTDYVRSNLRSLIAKSVHLNHETEKLSKPFFNELYANINRFQKP